MNACLAIARHVPAALVLATLAAPAIAGTPTPTLPPVQAEAVLYVADCAERALPSQRQVGEWTGQHNSSQVYATRQRLMAEIGRACQRNGVEQVRVVSHRADAARELVAIAERRK